MSKEQFPWEPRERATVEWPLLTPDYPNPWLALLAPALVAVGAVVGILVAIAWRSL